MWRALAYGEKAGSGTRGLAVSSNQRPLRNVTTHPRRLLHPLTLGANNRDWKRAVSPFLRTSTRASRGSLETGGRRGGHGREMNISGCTYLDQRPASRQGHQPVRRQSYITAWGASDFIFSLCTPWSLLSKYIATPQQISYPQLLPHTRSEQLSIKQTFVKLP